MQNGELDRPTIGVTNRTNINDRATAARTEGGHQLEKGEISGVSLAQPLLGP
jgi:hypothetical protein